MTNDLREQGTTACLTTQLDRVNGSELCCRQLHALRTSGVLFSITKILYDQLGSNGSPILQSTLSGLVGPPLGHVLNTLIPVHA